MVVNGLLFRIMDNKKSNQYVILKDVVSSIKNGNTFNLPGLLEILNTSTDVDVQVKLFSILSACLLLNDANFEAIVTYNLLYDKIYKILADCPPGKTTVAFNFLSALLYVDEEDNHRKKSLVAYARNMIRSSGCLATMCDIFTSCMMHQEAWRALCRCLAETCRGVEANQSYCTHLVPMCVQRCSQRNIEVLPVLQSLLQNHNRNTNLFMECNGISLFQREFLQHDVCLQLLAIIAQSSSQAVALIVKTNICQQLRDFLHLYGPQSQLGQWATIVLYHTSRVEGLCEGPKDDGREKLNNKLSQSLVTKINPVNQNQELECSADTTKFFQNVMKEIIHCGAQKEFQNLNAFFPTDIVMNRSQRNAVKRAPEVPFHDKSQRNKVWMFTRDINKSNSKNVKPNEIQNEYLQFNKTNELSFSFLRNQHLNNKHITSKFVTADKFPQSFQRTFESNESFVRRNTVNESHKENIEIHLNTLGTNDFKPKFSSTPKKGVITKTSRYEKQRSNNNTDRPVQNSIRNRQIKRRLAKTRVAKYLEQSKIVTEIKHKSLSGRFFDAINTSCTTFVKTVKNIFRPKTDLNETKEDISNNTSKQETLSCSYSFTNYMRKRDAVFNNSEINGPDKISDGLVDFKSKECIEDFSLEFTNSCNTCNNTISLKRKLVNDDHLKQSIRKLKLGINLYGCDFKKISRAFWPNESYMTPAVLYNLYRKLIIK